MKNLNSRIQACLVLEAILILALVLLFVLPCPSPPLEGFNLDEIIGAGHLKVSPSPTLTPSTLPSFKPSASPSGLETPMIALVLDDNGYNLEQFRAFIALPFPFTLSVLPSLKYSRQVAQEALSKGKEVILHCPMESYEGNCWLGPGAIFVSMSDEEIKKQVEADLYDVPGATGVNNHMGTKATEDERVMRAFLSYLKERGLYFLDSKVTAGSKASQIGRELGVIVLENDLSLDHDPDPQAIRENMKRLGEIARKRGVAIGIAHVYTRNLLPLFKELGDYWKGQGFRMVRLSETLPYFVSPSGRRP
ncbi:MAG: divergent polysaccharide deacetylase family protein [bacterium]